MKNFRDFIIFNAFGVGGVAKNGEIVFEKIRIFHRRGYPRSSSAVPGARPSPPERSAARADRPDGEGGQNDSYIPAHNVEFQITFFCESITICFGRFSTL